MFLLPMQVISSLGLYSLCHLIDVASITVRDRNAVFMAQKV